MGLVRDLRFRLPQKPDLSDIVARSLERDCPFCPENVERVTPKFVPEVCAAGRITVGDATVFPNTAPYMPYSAVAVITAEHFVGLADLTEQMLKDAFSACQIYLQGVCDFDSSAAYCGIMWNYLPPANSSQVHPHLQVFAGHLPLVHHRQLLDASRHYFREKGSIFWSDLITEEKRRGERFIGKIGNTFWLASFVPRSFQLDVRAVVSERESVLSLSSNDWEDLAAGLVRVFNYLDEQNHFSFNLCMYSGIVGEQSFWTHARLIQRGPLPPMAISDAGNMTLLGDTRVSIRSPEFICQELRPRFSQLA
jgi:galactose-1-phosphate uridylyltransferase